MKHSIIALGIGHGDAILIRTEDDTNPFTCLIDGGESPLRLNAALARNNVENIDLLILTHLDSDHIGGLLDLQVPIRQFWGPALKAFEKHKWLFGANCIKAIDRGVELEKLLTEQGTDILYPLEGYSCAPTERIRLGVLNPAARHIRSFITSPDASELVSDEASLGWLLETERVEFEESAVNLNLEGAMRRGFIEPQDLAAVTIGGRKPDVPAPEFWGDRAINNTSIVIYVEFLSDIKSHTALFTGDIEDWTYLIGRNPRGLNADIFKAPHHGGRVYIGGAKEAYDEVLACVRPKACIISANGRHGLPRQGFREAAKRIGATVFCTSQRGLEFVSTQFDGVDSCCFNSHGCTNGNSLLNDVIVRISDDGIVAPRPACCAGFNSTLHPIINVKQHIINPSPILGKLRENELRNHIRWVRKTLANIHEERKKSRLTETGGDLISQEHLVAMARSEGRWPVVAHIGTILEEGHSRNEFLAIAEHRGGHLSAYVLPDKDGVGNFLQFVGEAGLFVSYLKNELKFYSADSVIRAISTKGIERAAEVLLGFPGPVVRCSIVPAVLKEFYKSWTWWLYSVNNLQGSNNSFNLCVLANSGVTFPDELIEVCERREDRYSSKYTLNADFSWKPIKGQDKRLQLFGPFENGSQLTWRCEFNADNLESERKYHWKKLEL